MYYLTQGQPGCVSLAKLEQAMTLTERDPPLPQEGAEEIKRYEDTLRNQAKKGTPLEIIELLHFMKQNKLTMANVFKNT